MLLKTYSKKKGFISVSLFPFYEKVGRSIYDVTMAHYDVVTALFWFRFVDNAQES